jgi:hypothetical protein
MSDQNISFLKSNWLTFSNIVVLVSFIIYQARWQQRVDIEIKELEKSFIIHDLDNEKHRPLGSSIQLFVPRTELDKRLENIEKTLEKIEKKL